MPRQTKLTDELKENLFRALKIPLPLCEAARLAGTNEQTVQEWVRRGEGRHSSRKGNDLYAAFALEYRACIASTQEDLVKAWKAAAARTQSWQAFQKLLAIRFPETWADTAKVEVTVKQAVENAFEIFLQELEHRTTPEVYAEVLRIIVACQAGETEASESQA